MLKYTTSEVTFREIPDEITLCINISGCPIKCPDCHSKELWNNIGTELSFDELKRIIEQNKGITCVCFMGGDRSPSEILALAYVVRENFPILKTAWYSGKDEIYDIMVRRFDYLKLGPYIKELGGLSDPGTNQRMLKRIINNGEYKLEDITYKFWKSKQLCQEQKIG